MIRKFLNDGWNSDDDGLEEDACAICGGLKEDGLCPNCEDKDEGLGDGTDEFDDDNDKNN